MSVTVEKRIHFFDTDAMSVVHHANYIRWFEVGRVEYLRGIGIDLNEMMDDGYVFPIVSVSAEYHASGHYDDVVSIETTAVALTKAKMEFSYRVRRQPTGELLVTGASKNVFTRKDTGHITRLPPKYYEPLEQAMAREKSSEEAIS